MRKILVVAMALVLFVASGCSKKAERVGDKVPTDKLVGEVDNWQLSRDQLEEAVRRLPDEQRQKYSTPEGMAILAQRMMQEQLAYR